MFSRDGRWIAFTRETPPSPPARLIPAARPGEEVVSDFERKVAERFKGRIFDWMQYRVDGRGYRPDPRDPTASPPEELYLVAREGGTARRLTGLGVDVRDPEFSPDGQSLVVVANAHQRDEHTYERSDLWIVSVEGRVRRLTDDGYDHREPAWSPDGKWLAFTRQQGLSSVIARKQTHGGPIDLFVMPGGGGPSRNLTAGWDLRPGAPRFSPDGRFVYFTAGTGGRAHLFRVATAGGKVEQVTQGERRLTGVTFSASFQRMAYLSADLDRPAEVMIARLPGSQPPTDERRLSQLNDALLGQLALARTERIAYRSRDGTPIEGWVVLPPGYDASRRHPLILSIHGGPHGAYGTDFSFLFQLLAAQGYLVVLHQPPRLHRVRRAVPVGHLGRLGQPRFRGRAGRRGPRHRPLRRRPQAPRRDGIFVRRVSHQLAGGHLEPLRRRRGRRRTLQLDQRLCHLGHPAHQGERVLTAAPGSPAPATPWSASLR